MASDERARDRQVEVPPAADGHHLGVLADLGRPRAACEGFEPQRGLEHGCLGGGERRVSGAARRVVGEVNAAFCIPQEQLDEILRARPHQRLDADVTVDVDRVEVLAKPRARGFDDNLVAPGGSTPFAPSAARPAR